MQPWIRKPSGGCPHKGTWAQGDRQIRLGGTKLWVSILDRILPIARGKKKIHFAVK